MDLLILLLFIHLQCLKGFDDSFKYERLHMFGLGRPIVNIRRDNVYAYPEELSTKTQTYVKSPYNNIYQGSRTKRDKRVFNKHFDYPPRTRGHHIYCEGVFECTLTHVSIETNGSIPSILRGGVGYKHFSVAIRANYGAELSGRVRAYCMRQKYVVSTDRSGDIHVHVQGDLSQQDKRCVFVTVHDLGTNHTSMVDFVNSPAMSEIKERSCFIHVDVPGHEENSPDLPESYPFPSLQTLGEDLITVLDFLHVRYAVGVGEGAGANVLARCGLAHPRRLLGLILVNCTGSTSSVADAFRTRFSRWRGADISQSEEDFLIYHKFGHQINSDSFSAGERERMLAEYRSRLRGNLNTHNIKQYVRAFINRKDLVLKGCQPDILLITGTLSPYAAVVERMYRDLDKDRVTILKVEKAGDVLAETPAKVAQSLLLFCQGQSQLTSLPPPGVERRMSRAMSMEDYDKPNKRRLSLTPNTSDSPPQRKL